MPISFHKNFGGYFYTNRRSFTWAFRKKTPFCGDSMFYYRFCRNTWKIPCLENVQFRVARISDQWKSIGKTSSSARICGKLISLLFETNRASNGRTVTEKSRTYWEHPIFGQNTVHFYSHCQYLTRSSATAWPKGLIFLPYTFQVVPYRMVIERTKSKICRVENMEKKVLFSRTLS